MYKGNMFRKYKELSESIKNKKNTTQQKMGKRLEWTLHTRGYSND